MMTNQPQLHIFNQQAEIADFLFQQWQAASQLAVQERRPFTAALSGGRTPAPFLELLARQGRHLPWDKTHIFQVDERFVPLDHPDSNYRLLQETLLSQVDVPQDQIHIVPRDQSPVESARDYQAQMRRFFANQKPRLDCVLLGLGDDGHTASLFPGEVALQEQEAWVVAVHYAPVRHARISMTFPVLNAARKIIFLVAGEGKADIAQKVIRQRAPQYPASHIQPQDGELLFILDRAAAERL
jgi:6-phosphogluconolactonase